MRLKPRHMQFYDDAVEAGFLDSGQEDDGTEPPSPDSSTTPASSSTGRDSPRAPVARCTSRRSKPASARSTGSRTSAGRCRPARALDRRERPRHVTAARLEAPRLGQGRRGLPLVVHRDAGRVRRRCSRCTCRLATRSSSWSAAPIYDLLVQVLEQPRVPDLATPVTFRSVEFGDLGGLAERRREVQLVVTLTTIDRKSVVVVDFLVELDAVLLGEAAYSSSSDGPSSSCRGGSPPRSPNPRSNAPGPDCFNFRASSKRR